jgi:hypothetical protein
MRKVQFSCAQFLGVMVLLGLMISALPAPALEPEPHPLDTFLTAILNFREPTGIRGTLRYIEKDEQGIWLNWEERSDDRPLFDTGWKLVPEDTTLLVYPQDSAQYQELEHIAKGTPLEMVIQFDEIGHRRILSYQDLSHGRKVPL